MCTVFVGGLMDSFVVGRVDSVCRWSCEQCLWVVMWTVFVDGQLFGHGVCRRLFWHGVCKWLFVNGVCKWLFGHDVCRCLCGQPGMVFVGGWVCCFLLFSNTYLKTNALWFQDRHKMINTLHPPHLALFFMWMLTLCECTYWHSNHLWTVAAWPLVNSYNPVVASRSNTLAWIAQYLASMTCLIQYSQENYSFTSFKVNFV